MTSRVQHLRKNIAGEAPARQDGDPGVIAVNTADRQLFLRDAVDFNQMLAVRVFSEDAQYAAGDLALTPAGYIQRAIINISPSAFDPTQWDDHSAVSGALMARENLSDLDSIPDAVTNLGLDDVLRQGDLPDISDVVRQGDILDVVRTPQISDVLRTGDIGVNAGDIVAVDIDGKLPALDGSKLTNIATKSVKFLQSGTGAVERELQDKVRESVSVKDFGAKGDGRTDDTAAIKAALASATCILLPPGEYITSDTLVVSNSNTTIYGYGATIKRVTKALLGHAIAVRTDDSEILGLTISGPYTSADAMNGAKGIEFYDFDGRGAKKFRNLTIRDCRSRGFQYGIHAEGIVNLVVTGCRIFVSSPAGGMGNAMGAAGTLNTIIANNTFGVDDGQECEHNCYISGGTNVSILGNRMSGARLSNIQLWSGDCYNVIISNNVLSDVKHSKYSNWVFEY